MTVKTIGVLGAGQMGSGIAQVAAAAGYKVILRDIKLEFCSNAMKKIEAMLAKRVAAGKESQEHMTAILSNISISETMSDLKDCDMVIEAAIEDMQIKQSIFQELSDICRIDCIFCTNTSSMSITQIMSRVKKPERTAGMHFFYPVVLMKLVEVIRGEKTSDETVQAIYEVASKIGKTAVECKADTPGFFVNRCLFAFMLEAIRCYDDGVATIEDIDTAIRLGLNHPMGPFELMDMSGLDTLAHVTETLESLPVTSWECPSSVNQLVFAGKFGRKTGQGWYNYK